MISFLNSLVLPALAAATIPLIIHLLNRQKVKKIPFSSLRFLKLMENKRIRQVKLYHILVILFRTLFIIFLVLAFSRPTFTDNLLGFDSSASTTAVILMDDSYSMRQFEEARTRFEIARDLVLRLKQLFSAEDRLYILSASRPDPVQVPEEDELRAYIGNYEPGFTTPDMTTALDGAFNIFNSYPNLNRELYIVSDFRFFGPDFTKRLNAGLENSAVRLYFINPVTDEPPENVGIDSVIVLNQLFEINKPAHFSVTLTNHHPAETKNTLLHLYRDNQRVAMDQVSVAAARSTTVDMIFVPKQPGEQFLHFELEEDDLSADNNYYLNFTIPEELNILEVGDTPDRYLQSALQVLNKNTVLNFTRARYDNWQGFAFDNFDVLILRDPPAIQAATRDRIRDFFEAGKNIILIPGDSMNRTAVNTVFERFTGLQVYGSPVSVSGPESFFPLAPVSRLNDLFASLFLDRQEQFDSPRIRRYLQLPEDGEPLLLLNNGDPFLARYRIRDKSAFLYTLSSGTGPAWSDFHMKGFFIPFLYRLIYLAGQPGNEAGTRLTAGSEFTLKLSNQPLDEDFYLLMPGDERIDMVPEQSSTGLLFRLADLNSPGHYRFFQNQKLVSAFSVNTSSHEFRRPYLRKDDLVTPVVEITPGNLPEETIMEARTGFEMWPILVILALCALGAEMFTIKKIEGQAESNS